MENKHTHELRLLRYRDYEQKKSGNNISLYYYEVLVQGTKEECHSEVVRRAEVEGCGTGLLYNNGGYHIVNLEEERLNILKEYAPEMLEVLVEIRKWYEENQSKYLKDITPVCFSKALSVIMKAQENNKELIYKMK